MSAHDFFSVFFPFLAGTLGAGLEQFGEYMRAKSERRQFNLLLAVGATLLIAFLAALEISLIYDGPLPIAFVATMLSGAFLAALFEEIIGLPLPPVSTEESEKGRTGLAVTAAGGTALVLNGFWFVYGAGCFGAFLVELHFLYKKRTKLPSFPWYYWLISVLMILASGGLVVVYGTSGVNAILAVQTGATAPLLINRWAR